MSNELINRQYVGARYVPKIMGEWNKALQYEALSVVTYMGNSFTSKVPVPANVDITNEKYWINTGNYNAQVEAYRKETAQLKTDLNNETTNRKNADKDNILWIGDSYSVNYNHKLPMVFVICYMLITGMNIVKVAQVLQVHGLVKTLTI